MGLAIEVDRAFRYDSDLRRLVAAVRDGHGHNETEWIEWKIAIDGADQAAKPLLTAAADEVIARAILGFANRDPAVAAPLAEGCGYLLIGVQPGEVRGVKTADPEKICSRVRRYVGGRISWRPEYTRIDDKDVLVVIVDPPQLGDPIHALMKGMQNRQAGTIFIRHPGKTEQADADDVDMLTRRASARGDRIEIVVRSVRDTIEPTPDPKRHFEQWAAEQRPKLLAARYTPPPRRSVDSDLVRFAEQLMRTQPDKRTEEEYEQQVDKYLAEVQAALPLRAARRQALFAPARLGLEVVNPTDNHLTDLLVEVHVLAATTYSDRFLHELEDHHDPRVPARPVPLGTPRSVDGLSGLGPIGFGRSSYSRDLLKPAIYRRPGRGWTAYVCDDRTLHVEFAAFDLRAKAGRLLPEVPLRLDDNAGQVARVVWSASASNIKGRLDGEIALTVSPSMFDFDSVFTDAE